ncbi:MAG: hypothetical protein V1874_17885 [Spirochaetota bacterium]
MTVENNKNNSLKYFAVGSIGLLIGNWLTNRSQEESKMSRAELDDPDLTEDVCDEIGEILDEIELEGEYKNEDELRDALAKQLKKETDFEIEIAANTPFGKPDILIEGTLALEVKVNPVKTEMDRCIGQCAGYSREWVTWIILFDTPKSKENQIQHILDDKGLDNILIVSYIDEEDRC